MKSKLWLPLLCWLFVACQSQTKETLTQVMSFNIRYDNSEDAPHHWEARRDSVVNVIKKYDVDLLGMQEVLHHQLAYLKEQLPAYESVGVGREDGETKGEYAPILYKKAKYRAMKQGYFWLSETPEVAGKKGWDAACERIVTWVLLEEIATKHSLLMMNTHFDHVGEEARRKSVDLLVAKAKELSEGGAVIITGDFNADPKSEVITKMLDEKNVLPLFDTRLIAQSVAGTSWTFHDFGQLPLEERPLIDYIFVNEAWGVRKYEVLEDRGEVYLSDHAPVFTVLKRK